MTNFVVIFILQLLFQFVRVLSTRAIIAKHMPYLMLNTAAIQALWLVTTYYGVMAMMNSDWRLISGYMAGGLLGAYLSFRVGKHINMYSVITPPPNFFQKEIHD